MTKKVTTLYLTTEPYEELKKVCNDLGISISSKIDELVKKAVEELTGVEYDSKAEALEYGELKSRHRKLFGEANKIERMLDKKKVYQKVRRCSLGCGIDEEKLDFPPEVVKCMLESYEGYPEDVHFYISLMELIKEKREVERQLTEIRLNLDGTPFED